MKIKFPQIVVEFKEIEVSEDVYEDLINSGDYEIVEFIWSKLTENEKDFTPNKDSLLNALDVGYCGVELIK